MVFLGNDKMRFHFKAYFQTSSTNPVNLINPIPVCEKYDSDGSRIPYPIRVSLLTSWSESQVRSTLSKTLFKPSTRRILTFVDLFSAFRVIATEFDGNNAAYFYLFAYLDDNYKKYLLQILIVSVYRVQMYSGRCGIS